MLDGKRVVVTGVLTRQSLAYACAARIQELGGELMLTSFGRTRRMTERAAQHLVGPPEILELDARRHEDFAALTAEVSARWKSVDGVVHSIAGAAQNALGGGFLTADAHDALEAIQVSAVSFRDLAVAMRPLMRKAGGGSVVGLDFDGSVAWPQYDWMGVAKAALEGISRYCARDLGGDRIRANLVAAGPLHSTAAGAFHDFGALATAWAATAPLGWDPNDGSAVADVVCFLLSDLSRCVTGEIVHADGGAHAIGAGVIGEPAGTTNAALSQAAQR